MPPPPSDGSVTRRSEEPLGRAMSWLDGHASATLSEDEGDLSAAGAAPSDTRDATSAWAEGVRYSTVTALPGPPTASLVSPPTAASLATPCTTSPSTALLTDVVATRPSLGDSPIHASAWPNPEPGAAPPEIDTPPPLSTSAWPSRTSLTTPPLGDRLRMETEPSSGAPTARSRAMPTPLTSPSHASASPNPARAGESWSAATTTAGRAADSSSASSMASTLTARSPGLPTATKQLERRPSRAPSHATEAPSRDEAEDGPGTPATPADTSSALTTVRLLLLLLVVVIDENDDDEDEESAWRTRREPWPPPRPGAPTSRRSTAPDDAEASLTSPP